MITTNDNFDAKNELAAKTPLYTVEFDGETTLYCNHVPASPTETYSRILNSMAGLSQTIVPEKGQASIGGVKPTITDKAQAITALLNSDTYNFHRRKVIVKAGYKGMAEADLLTIATNWVTGIKLSSDGAAWEFDATDPQKWMQKTIFRTATDASPIVISGNAIKILLNILMSTDAGTNGEYDLGSSDYGVGLTSDVVDVDAIEKVRDDWFWGQLFYMKFTITEEIEAKEFIETEILQVLNCYPGITGAGKYKIIPAKPPITKTSQIAALDEDSIIDISLDLNFKSMINETEWAWDYDHVDGEYDTELYTVDSDSYENRGNASKALRIESKGLHSDLSPASLKSHARHVIDNRNTSVFNRYASPPAKIRCKCWFSKWIAEAGDIVPLTHSKVANVATGTRGISGERVEVVSRKPDWKNGSVSFDLLATGFNKGTFSAFSPDMTITAASSATAFTVSSADATKWTEGWEAQILDHMMRVVAASITILTINPTTGAITCDNIGQTPSSGWMVVFADYDNATDDQKRFAYIADASNQLGTANDPAHLISP